MPLVKIDPVMTRATKRTPAKPTAFRAVVDTGKSIAVSFDGRPENVFKVGDMAEYDSWNLSYYGTIYRITEKTVTIVERFGDKSHRLTIEQFCNKNWNWSLEETKEKDAITSLYI